MVERKHVWVSRSEGCYNFLDPSERQVQYYFHHLPKDMDKSFLIDPKYDYVDMSDAYSAAIDIQHICKTKYLYTSALAKIEKVVTWFKEHEDEQDALKAEYDLKVAREEMMHHIDSRLRQIGKYSFNKETQESIYTHPTLERMKKDVKELWG